MEGGKENHNPATDSKYVKEYEAAVRARVLCFTRKIANNLHFVTIVRKQGEILMDEKILIRTEKASLKSLVLRWIAYSFIVSLCLCLIIFNILGAEIDSLFITPLFFSTLLLFGVFAICGMILRKSELTITDKRAYGKAAFGHRVDLPLDSISTVTTGMFKTLTISTSSGQITFAGILNLDEFHSILSKLIVERQNKPSTTIKQEIPQSNADELKKYKELLDSGVISQEEFDAKKKQLLGL